MTEQLHSPNQSGRVLTAFLCYKIHINESVRHADSVSRQCTTLFYSINKCDGRMKCSVGADSFRSVTHLAKLSAVRCFCLADICLCLYLSVQTQPLVSCPAVTPSIPPFHLIQPFFVHSMTTKSVYLSLTVASLFFTSILSCVSTGYGLYPLARTWFCLLSCVFLQRLIPDSLPTTACFSQHCLIIFVLFT